MSDYKKAILAGGCFWWLESEFRGKPGVLKTVAGYTGGTLENPSYKDVTTGTTGHAEALLIYYDPAATSYEKLLEHFFLHAHDPTTLNSQWVDQGTQYRSAIFYLNEDQKAQAEAYFKNLTERHLFKKPIVTAVEKAGIFWPAEAYHQNYYEKYKEQTGKEHIRVKLKKKVIEEREREIEKNSESQNAPQKKSAP